jgi:hypothetical protein
MRVTALFIMGVLFGGPALTAPALTGHNRPRPKPQKGHV